MSSRAVVSGAVLLEQRRTSSRIKYNFQKKKERVRLINRDHDCECVRKRNMERTREREI